MKVFRLPDLGEGLQDAEIVSWHVTEGDHLVADQPLLSVETDKAVVEIPSPYSGNVVELLAAPGDVVKIGAELVRLDNGDRIDAGTVVGELPADATVSIAAPDHDEDIDIPMRASPAVRRLARELDVDLSAIEGSGPRGTITSDDINEAARGAGSKGVVERVSGVRRSMARTMALAGAEVVPATVTDEVDVENWIANGDILVRLVRAVEAGVQAEPGLNAWFDAARGERRLFRSVDLGIAVDTPDGLFAPVLADTGSRSDESLRKGLKQLREDVVNRTVPPSALRGQTFTLSNFGMLGGRHATLVVVPPQVAILGAGRIYRRVVLSNGNAASRRTLPLSLTFDHRVVTGGEAARFLAAVMARLEL